MFRVETVVDRPPRSSVRRIGGFSTPVLADVLETNRGVMDSGIKPTGSADQVVGTAITVDAPPGDNLVVHKATSVASEGDVLVLDADGYSESGIWGELLSVAAVEKGVQGTIVDGGVRDIAEVSDLDYPVFARHVSPKGSTKTHPGSINVPISCGGAAVTPGDVVVGDENGVVVVPKDGIDGVVKACEKKQVKEQQARKEKAVYRTYATTFDEEFGDQ